MPTSHHVTSVVTWHGVYPQEEQLATHCGKATQASHEAQPSPGLSKVPARRTGKPTQENDFCYQTKMIMSCYVSFSLPYLCLDTTVTIVEISRCASHCDDLENLLFHTHEFMRMDMFVQRVYKQFSRINLFGTFNA